MRLTLGRDGGRIGEINGDEDGLAIRRPQDADVVRRAVSARPCFVADLPSRADAGPQTRITRRVRDEPRDELRERLLLQPVPKQQRMHT